MSLSNKRVWTYVNAQLRWRHVFSYFCVICISGLSSSLCNKCMELSKWKGNCQSTDNTKNRKRKKKLLLKNKEISGRKPYTNTRKINWNISMITEAFTLLLLRKTSVIVEIFQLSFLAFAVSFFRRSLYFLVRGFSFFSYFLQGQSVRNPSYFFLLKYVS